MTLTAPTKKNGTASFKNTNNVFLPQNCVIITMLPIGINSQINEYIKGLLCAGMVKGAM